MKITPDTFIISDTHFGHKLVLKKEPSRVVALNNTHFKNFDDLSVSWWNEVVQPQDYVLHLGDLFFADGDDILPKLHGNKILVIGNNDVGKCENLKNWNIISKIKFKIPEKDELKKIMKICLHLLIIKFKNSFKTIFNGEYKACCQLSQFSSCIH